MKDAFIIDSNSLIHRAYHAMPAMNSKDGTPTQAIYGFINILFKIIKDYSPNYLIAAFDTPTPTHRHVMFDDYKGTRKPTDADLKVQFPILKQLLVDMGVCVVEKDGLEADDLLGIYSRKAAEESIFTYLLTGDKDSLQLVDDNTKVIMMRRGISQTDVYDKEKIKEIYGMTPLQLIDLKGLMGDSSDNIPGVPGVGEKTGMKLIHEYGTMEEVLANAGNVSGPKLRSNLVEFADQARMSRDLGEIIVDKNIDLGINIKDAVFDESKMSGGRKLMRELGFKSLINRLPAGDEDEAEDIALKIIKRKEIKIANEIELGKQIQDIIKAQKLAMYFGRNICFADEKTEWIINIKRDLLSDGFLESEALTKLRNVLESNSEKIMFDAKETMHFLDKLDLKTNNNVFDIMISAYLLQEENMNSIEKLCKDLFDIDDVSASVVYDIHSQHERDLEEKDMLELMNKIEMPLIPVLFDMEKYGFSIDKKVLTELGEEYQKSIDMLDEEIHSLAGDNDFNILSPKQIGKVLFEDLGLPTARKGKTGYSTDAATLEGLQEINPIAGLILEYRQNSKLKSTYIDGLLKSADDGGRIHTQFKQTGAITGRLSSVEPNLQNIPVRSTLGREIRRAFIPSEGNTLVCADYSQIELRILAHISKDENMIKAFRDGMDIHAATAASVAEKRLEDVTSDERGAAKAVNFGIVYGISDYGLSQQLGISRKAAEEYIANYFKQFPGVEEYLKSSVEEAKNKGYSETIFKRKRMIPQLRSPNYFTRSSGERIAMNAPIQGSAADIIKIAMIDIFAELYNRKLKSKMILQVHDELIFDTVPDEKEEVISILKDKMEGVIELLIPLKVDVGTGMSWYEAK